MFPFDLLLTLPGRVRRGPARTIRVGCTGSGRHSRVGDRHRTIRPMMFYQLVTVGRTEIIHGCSLLQWGTCWCVELNSTGSVCQLNVSGKYEQKKACRREVVRVMKRKKMFKENSIMGSPLQICRMIAHVVT